MYYEILNKNLCVYMYAYTMYECYVLTCLTTLLVFIHVFNIFFKNFKNTKKYQKNFKSIFWRDFSCHFIIFDHFVFLIFSKNQKKGKKVNQTRRKSFSD